jgi:hypothetical protein
VTDDGARLFASCMARGALGRVLRQQRERLVLARSETTRVHAGREYARALELASELVVIGARDRARLARRRRS